MFLIDSTDYIPLLSATIATCSKEINEVKKLFEEEISCCTKSELKELFCVHPFCSELTVEQYSFYQYIFALFKIVITKNKSDLDLKIQKIFRRAFEDIYRIVKKNKSFNINDYFFLSAEADSVTLVNKMMFGNRAIALMFFVGNRWGNYNKEAYLFSESLFQIVSSTKCMLNVTQEKGSIEWKKVKNLKKNIILKLTTECYERLVEELYKPFLISFESIYSELGEDSNVINTLLKIDNYIYDGFEDENKDELILFLCYQIVVLLYSLERNFNYISREKGIYVKYENELLKKENISYKQKLENLLVNKEHDKQALIWKNEEINRQLESSLKKIHLMQSEVKQVDKLMKETAALRSYVYFQENYENVEEELVDWNKVNVYQGVIIGGSDNWQQKLHTKLPNWRFIPSSMDKFDKSVIANSKYVFVNTLFIGHSLYYKVLGIIQSHETVIMGFINSHNLERVYREIVDQLMR